MTRREPSDDAVLSARLMRAYPSLSPYSAASLATELCAIERVQRRHAERCCSGEDGGYVQLVVKDRGMHDGYRCHRTVAEHDPDAERRAGERIERKVEAWKSDLRGRLIATHGYYSPQEHGYAIELQGDPRGRVLLLRLPGETEASSV